MKRLSSNFTIILRLFIPLIYIVFFGCLLIGSFFVTVNDSPFIANPVFRYGLLITYTIFVTLLYFTFMKLKRVDADTEYLYISNYFKTYRYTWDSISKLNTVNLIVCELIYVHLKEKSAFGKRIVFLASKPLVKSFFAENPDLFNHFYSSEAPMSQLDK